MKIFGIVFFKKQKLDRILQLLKGNKEDVLIAYELLGGEEKIKPPEYKIAVSRDMAFLYFKNKDGDWKMQASRPGNYVDEMSRQNNLEILKKEMDKKPFEDFEIYY